MHSRSEVMDGEEHILVNLKVLLFLRDCIFCIILEIQQRGQPANYSPISFYLDNFENTFYT